MVPSEAQRLVNDIRAIQDALSSEDVVGALWVLDGNAHWQVIAEPNVVYRIYSHKVPDSQVVLPDQHFLTTLTIFTRNYAVRTNLHHAIEVRALVVLVENIGLGCQHITQKHLQHLKAYPLVLPWDRYHRQCCKRTDQHVF